MRFQRAETKQSVQWMIDCVFKMRIDVILFFLVMALSCFHPVIGHGQSQDSTILTWYHGFRFQVTVGVTIEESSYREYNTGSPATSAAFINNLAGFNRRGINPMSITQVDFDVLRKSEILSLYTGLGWTFNSIAFYGVKDSLIEYQLDSTVLNKRIMLNNLDLVIALNAEKFFGFHAELGLALTLFGNYRFSEYRNANWKLTKAQTNADITASRIYTSLGYPFAWKGTHLTPIVRLDYYPFHTTKFAISGGISISIQHEKR